ncbi:MAG: TRAPP subunit bet5 [Vezdaea aestivalis]|nr:MAG: TRAPP subunit bet5 [Vezdaea aestivalis]
MVVYSFYIFDRHTSCIYSRRWTSARPTSTGSTEPPSSSGGDRSGPVRSTGGRRNALSATDDAKLIFGVVFSLRGMVRKLGGDDDSFVSYRTNSYKLHYYETASNLKFVMLTDPRSENLRIVLHQIYVNLYVEYVVKNPLAPAEHLNGEGVANELFEMGLDSFIVRSLARTASSFC